MRTIYYKYPRTPHAPFSCGYTDDDKRLLSMSHFSNMHICVTEKMDGENTTIYNDGYHARSLDSKHRKYHSYLLNCILPKVQYQIPDGWRICGEYLYAKHSIKYTNLDDYFLCFSVWANDNMCLSWKDTVSFCENINICTVPVLYDGIYNESLILTIAENIVNKGGEGIVIRNAESFSYNDFSQNIAKFVRPNHVQTDNHWSSGKIEKNLIK